MFNCPHMTAGGIVYGRASSSKIFSVANVCCSVIVMAAFMNKYISGHGAGMALFVKNTIIEQLEQIGPICHTGHMCTYLYFRRGGSRKGIFLEGMCYPSWHY